MRDGQLKWALFSWRCAQWVRLQRGWLASNDAEWA